MDHVKFRYMLELPNYLRVLIHLGLRENLFSRVNQQETIKIFSHNCYLLKSLILKAAKRLIQIFDLKRAVCAALMRIEHTAF